jgi:GTP-binding protein EngB required for normal cell division
MPFTWHIYHVENCPQSKPPFQNKFVAIVCKDAKFMGFFINSKIRSYVQKRPALRACQVVIDALNHRCLDDNSYVDCVELIKFGNAQLVNCRDPISKQTKEKIEAAVANADTIPPHYKKLILGR